MPTTKFKITYFKIDRVVEEVIDKFWLDIYKSTYRVLEVKPINVNANYY